MNGKNFIIPKGFKFDGASVPKFLGQFLSPVGVLLIGGLIHDYGYKYANKKFLEFYGNKNDVLIAISSSGESLNNINAVKYAKKIGFSKIITLSGFKKNNKLKQIGDINFWINSKNYNIIENSHQVLLLTLIDFISNKKF